MAQNAAVSESFDSVRLFNELSSVSPLPVSATKRKVFGELTGVDYYDLDAIWLGHKSVPSAASASSLVSHLSLLLEVRKRDAASILGVSESRVSRNDKVDVPMLDRAQGVSEVFAGVAAVLGPEGAQHWFKTPNPGLDGEPPHKLLGTNYGARRVENLITALLNGAVV